MLLTIAIIGFVGAVGLVWNLIYADMHENIPRLFVKYYNRAWLYLILLCIYFVGVLTYSILNN